MVGEGDLCGSSGIITREFVRDIHQNVDRRIAGILPVIGSSGRVIGAEIAPTMLEAARGRLKEPAFGIVKLSRFGRDEVQRARLYATAVALRHCAAASDRKIRRVEREIRCR